MSKERQYVISPGDSKNPERVVEMEHERYARYLRRLKAQPGHIPDPAEFGRVLGPARWPRGKGVDEELERVRKEAEK